MLGGSPVSPSLFWLCYFGFIETLLQSGMRSSEALVKACSDWHPSDHLTRASLVWVIQGKHVVSPTKAQLEGLTEDDYAIILPPPSKTDEFGVVWGDKPIYLPVRYTASYCAALRLRDIELELPVVGKNRANIPLFCDDEQQPIVYHKAHKILSDIKDRVLTDEFDKSLFTYHSFRVTLASQLGAKGYSDGEIQSACRWLSASSLRIYKRMQPAQAVRMLDDAQAANIDSYTAANLPTISSLDFVQGVHAYNTRSRSRNSGEDP